MDRIRIIGGQRLNGSIPISGAKNATLPLMIASLLTDETLILENVPRLADVALLHCVSAYPVPEGSENLRAIATLADAFNLPVGLSDHGADTSAWPLAVALGASIYERHIVLSGNDGSIDAAVSSDRVKA